MYKNGESRVCDASETGSTGVLWACVRQPHEDAIHYMKAFTAIFSIA